MSDDVLVALAGMVNQHCVPYYKRSADDPDEVCANGLSANEDAMCVLSDAGLLDEVKGVGRCIYASWTDLGKSVLEETL